MFLGDSLDQYYFLNENLFPFESKSYEINLNYNNFKLEEEERNKDNDFDFYFTCPNSLKECEKKGKKLEKKIFLIVKTNKPDLSYSNKPKKGRRTKNTFRSDQNENVEFHSKLKEDNIIQKLKVFFIKSAMIFINKRYENFLNNRGEKKAILLMKIKSIYAQSIKKEKNLEFLRIKIKDLFSCELSEKCTKLNKDYNKNQINKIYEKNEAQEVIEILNKKVSELLNNYINGTYKDEGFYIEYDLKKIEEFDKKNKNEYTKKFIETAKNFSHIFHKKISRRKFVRK